ncbi:MAG: alpha/beta hydrolase [Chloroflexi bacterium]|nr:alpha/beta hydrolase [Chloroflexota bacterium]NOG62140.1 alpha/beta hydrolase [Chloroflexota bacterium]
MNITKGFAEVENSKLYYEVAGEGHPLLLVHPMLTSHKYWDDQFSEFAKQYRVIRYDVRGFGQSKMSKEPYTDTRDIIQLLDFFGIEKTYLLGLSFGGEIAMHFTLEHPERVDGLVMSGVGLEGYEYSAEGTAEFEPKWMAFIERIQNHDFDGARERFIEFAVDSPVGRADEKVRERARALMQDYTFPHFLPPDDAAPAMEEIVPAESQQVHMPAIQRLHQIQVPTLVMAGGYEAKDIQDIVDILARDIPHAQKAVIPKAGHFVSLEKPAEFNRVVLDFLSHLG